MATETTEGRRDIRMMSLEEIEDELARLDERRRLLMRARRFIAELATEPPPDGRPKGRRD